MICLQVYVLFTVSYIELLPIEILLKAYVHVFPYEVFYKMKYILD